MLCYLVLEDLAAAVGPQSGIVILSPRTEPVSAVFNFGGVRVTPVTSLARFVLVFMFSGGM